MNHFKKYNTPSTPIFRNIKYLDPECLPREFHHRNQEMNTIASNISPIFYGSVPLHTIILGNNATGKTTAIRKLFEEVEEELPEVITVYINCRKKQTQYKIYSTIYEKVFQKQAPPKGSSSYKILTDIMNALEITRQPLLIALDDINYLLGPTKTASPHSQNVIRDLARANETYGAIIGIYPILTGVEFKYQFDREVASVFPPNEVLFRDYTLEDIFNIIKERCDYVFYNQLPDEVLHAIAVEVKKDDNLRRAWPILKELGLRMQSEGKPASMQLLKEIIEKEN